MKYVLFVLCFFIFSLAEAQNVITTEGQTFVNSDDIWLGVNIPRDVPSTLVFKNNSITSKNREGYMLQAGDEAPAPQNNNLDNALISGNRLTWTGTDMESITHGVFTGHNRNVTIKYNYVDHAPMGIIRKSGNNMSNTGGGVAYNIVKGGAVAVVVKGMSNVNIYNNTLYSDRTPSQTWRPLVHIYTNTDNNVNSVAHGTRIFNNIFYTKYRTFMITIEDNESLKDFQSDYNVFWSESGSPLFSISGTTMTFEQWKARGYDVHSVVLNPHFKDFTSFVPSTRLDHGTNLGDAWAAGLSPVAVWGKTDPATSMQNGTWQVGAVVYASTGVTSSNFSSAVINDSTPSVLEISFTAPLAAVVPAPESFTVTVNSMQRQVTAVNVSGTRVLLTLESPVFQGEHITVTYVKPDANPLQGASGEIIPGLTARKVTNNIGRANPAEPELTVFPNPATDYFKISNIRTVHLPGTLKMYDLSGKLRYEYNLNSDIVQIIPIDLSPGVYILFLYVGTEIRHSQKLIVVR